MLLLAGAASGLAGCAPATEEGRPSPQRGPDFARPLQVYRQLGLITGGEAFPAVGTLSTLAGTGDSTLVLFGLSLPANALRFQRDGDLFSADYLVALRFFQGEQVVHRVERRETVRVPTFAETGRADESVVFQTAVNVQPGDYRLEVRVRDGLSARGFEAEHELRVPEYGPEAERLSAPIVVYQWQGRTASDAPLRVIVNPRHTAPYGGEPPRVYLERYDGGQSVLLTAVDESGSAVWSRRVPLEGSESVMAGAVALPVDSLPLGRFWLHADAGGRPSPRVPLLVTISDGWLVANFEEVVQFLRYIADPAEIEALREGSAPERRERWEAFWAERDPVPATPVNEFRETFFERIRVATDQFAEQGRPGWRTDRGEVYIVLGPPTQYVERQVGRDLGITGQPNAQEWIYDRASGAYVSILFVDRNGFGSYEMTPSSEAAFREVARRLRER